MSSKLVQQVIASLINQKQQQKVNEQTLLANRAYKKTLAESKAKADASTAVSAAQAQLQALFDSPLGSFMQAGEPQRKAQQIAAGYLQGNEVGKSLVSKYEDELKRRQFETSVETSPFFDRLVEHLKQNPAFAGLSDSEIADQASQLGILAKEAGIAEASNTYGDALQMYGSPAKFPFDTQIRIMSLLPNAESRTAFKKMVDPGEATGAGMSAIFHADPAYFKPDGSYIPSSTLTPQQRAAREANLSDKTSPTFTKQYTAMMDGNFQVHGWTQAVKLAQTEANNVLQTYPWMVTLLQFKGDITYDDWLDNLDQNNPNYGKLSQLINRSSVYGDHLPDPGISQTVFNNVLAQVKPWLQPPVHTEQLTAEDIATLKKGDKEKALIDAGDLNIGDATTYNSAAYRKAKEKKELGFRSVGGMGPLDINAIIKAAHKWAPQVSGDLAPGQIAVDPAAPPMSARQFLQFLSARQSGNTLDSAAVDQLLQNATDYFKQNPDPATGNIGTQQ